MNKSNIVKSIKIFEPEINNEKFDKISEGIILIDKYNRFNGILFYEDDCQLINGYFGEKIVFMDLIGRSIYASKIAKDSYVGSIDSLIKYDETSPCKVFVRSFKNSDVFNEDRIDKALNLLNDSKVLKLERTL